MEDKHEIWKAYKQKVIEGTGDFSELFAALRKQKAGSDGWVSACCAFHDDKNPSFAFNRRTGQWCCFSGCGKGSAFDFLMQTTGASFKEALFSLGDKAGIPRPETNGHNPERLSEAYVEKMAKALAANEKVRKYLRDKRGLTDDTVRKHQIGWDAKLGRLVIPIRDEKNKLVNVRLYSPSKQPKMMNLKGYGNTPRLYGAGELAKSDGGQVTLCEGEFDRLVLCQNGFAAVTSTHGCRSFRQEWLPVFKDKDVVVLYDCDAEGQAAVEAIVLKALQGAEVRSIKNVRLPLAGTKDDKDVTDYFVKPHQVNGDLLEKRGYTAQELQKLIDETPPLNLTGFSPGAQSGGDKSPSLLQVIDAIRKADDATAHERHVAVAEAVAGYFTKRGALFFDPKACLEFLCLDGQVLTLGNNRMFNALLQEIGNLNITNSEGKFVWEFLRNYARRKGSPIKSASWIYGDPAKPAVYVHTHDEQGRVLRIAPNSITFIPNGQNDERILLNPSDRVQPFRYLADVDLQRGLAALKDLVYDCAPCADADRAFLLAYAPIIFLGDFCPMKPLVRLAGPHGSGKTSVASSISYVHYGENVGKISTSAANFTDASKNPLTVLDNIEAKDFDKELLNFLLTSSTGIVHEKRKLYVDQEIIRERANSFIILTGIESLGKPELLSRQWEIACDKSHFRTGFSEAEHIARIKRARDEILSAVFKLLAQEILPRLAMRVSIENSLTARFDNHPKSRTFGCLSLVLIVWDALERLLDLPRNLDQAWIAAQHAVADESAHETNLFVQFLGLAQACPSLEPFGVKRQHVDSRACLETSSVGLHNLFSRLAKEYGLPQPFGNAKQLGERLMESVPILRRAGWEVEMKARVVHGLRLHRFYLPEEKTNIDANLGATHE